LDTAVIDSGQIEYAAQTMLFHGQAFRTVKSCVR